MALQQRKTEKVIENEEWRVRYGMEEDEDEDVVGGKSYTKKKNNNSNNKSNDLKVKREEKRKKRRWDAVVVAVGMMIGFSVIVMKITGYWPCNIISTLQTTGYWPQQISCGKSIQENVSSIIRWIQQQYQGRFLSPFLSQFLQSI
ncbi:MAG: hypothetical protein WCF06_16610 [Nitrososphaeraceae archaeon]